MLPCQVSPHPRGRNISFVDTLAPFQEKTYTYRELPAPVQTLNSRKCYVGAERVRDIVNDYDPVTYRLPYGFENQWFRLSYRPQTGVASFVDKRTGRELLGQGAAPFFTPIYERTPLTLEYPEFPCREEQERRLLVCFPRRDVFSRVSRRFQTLLPPLGRRGRMKMGKCRKGSPAGLPAMGRAPSACPKRGGAPSISHRAPRKRRKLLQSAR